MKKQLYITPATIVVRIHTSSMIAQSPLGINTNDSDAITETDKLLSRESKSLWDDEE